jgi:hypothetical protein
MLLEGTRRRQEQQKSLLKLQAKSPQDTPPHLVGEICVLYKTNANLLSAFLLVFKTDFKFIIFIFAFRINVVFVLLITWRAPRICALIGCTLH